MSMVDDGSDGDGDANISLCGVSVSGSPFAASVSLIELWHATTQL